MTSLAEQLDRILAQGEDAQPAPCVTVGALREIEAAVLERAAQACDEEAASHDECAREWRSLGLGMAVYAVERAIQSRMCAARIRALISPGPTTTASPQEGQ